MSTSSFPDVNVWIALVWDGHVHSEAALRWFTSSQGSLYFCRHTQLGLLRLLTTSAMMGADTKSSDEAWQLWDQIWADPRIAFHAEPEGLDPDLRRFSSSPRPSSKVWADAYLLAFAKSADLRLVTLDRALANRSANALLLEP